MPKSHRVDIAITANTNGSYSTTATDPSNPPVKPGDPVDFYFSRPSGFPAGSVLFAQFFKKNTSGAKVDSKGCINGSNWKQGRGTTAEDGSAITGGRVGNLANGTFPYLIGYTMNGLDEELLDPEIVVEGNRPKTPRKPKNSRPAARKRPVKKAKKAAPRTARSPKAAKKAKRSTKLKPSPKRKAKKR